MEQLITTIVKGLVDDKDSVRVTHEPAAMDGTIVYHVHVASTDMGRVIGKQGRIAKSIRSIVRAAAIRLNEKAVVEID